MTEFMEAPPILWEGRYDHNPSPDSHKESMANEVGFCYLLNALMQLQMLCCPPEGN